MKKSGPIRVPSDPNPLSPFPALLAAVLAGMPVLATTATEGPPSRPASQAPEPVQWTPIHRRT